MSNNKQTTALNQHLKWLKKELKRVIDDGESLTCIYAYQLAIKNAESLIEKEKKQIILAITATLPIEDGVFTAIDKAHEYYNKTYGGNNEQQ
jgi:hypothetical protein